MCNWIDTAAAKPGHDMQVLLYAPENKEFILARYDARYDMWHFNDAPSERTDNEYFTQWSFLTPPKKYGT